jgi:hypothetical protein
MPDFSVFERFKKDLPWFFKPTDKIILEEGSLELTHEFQQTFPLLHQLVTTAKVIDLKLNDDTYKFLHWKVSEKGSCAWLCKFEAPDVKDIQLLPEHELLLQNIGGIKEYYMDPEETLINNQNFLFLKSECETALGYANIYYEQVLKAENMKAMPIDNLVTFVIEANGSPTVYDLNSKQVYFFSHDCGIEYMIPMEGQPNYTFYHIRGVNNFGEYVETLAKQWIDYIAAGELHYWPLEH